MNYKSKITALGIFTLLLFSLHGQEACKESLFQAQKDYEIGAFEWVETGLVPCLESNTFNKKEQIQGWRILALSYIANDFPEKATLAIQSILKIDNTYEANLYDPTEFINQLDNLRSINDIQYISSVSKKNENINTAPATIQVITEDDIKLRGYNDIMELLQDLPGFQISRSYGPALGNVYQRGFRTNDTEKTLVLVDGIEENDLWSNRAYISRQYPLSNIKRVEIVYGPSSTMYGPNAFSGVINIITKEPWDIVIGANKIGVSAEAGIGSFNHKFIDATIAYKHKNISSSLTSKVFDSGNHDLTSQSFFDYDPAIYDSKNYDGNLSIRNNAQQYIDSTGLPLNSDLYTIHQTNGIADSIILTDQGRMTAAQLDKSAYNQTVGGFPIGYSNNDKSYLVNYRLRISDFTLGAQTWKKVEGGSTQFTDEFATGSDNGSVWSPKETFFYLKYEAALSEELFLTSLSNYRIHEVENSKLVFVSNYARRSFDLFNLSQGREPVWNNSSLYQNSKQFRSELKLNYTPNQKFDLISGLEIRNSQLQGNYLVSLNDPNPQENGVFDAEPQGGNQTYVNDYGIYSQAKTSITNSLSLVLGARIDHNVIGTSGGYGTKLNARAVIIYAKNNWISKAIYSSGIMNVSNFTKFSTTGNRIPNPNLRTENIKNFEWSIRNAISKKLTIDATTYYSIITDVVGLVQLGEQETQNQQIGDFNIFGVQTNLQYKDGPIRSYINYSYTSAKQNKNAFLLEDLKVGDIASHTINAGTTYQLNDLISLSIRANYISSQPVGNGTTVPLNNDELPSYLITNGNIRFNNIIKGGSVLFSVNNILNKRYFNPGVKAADGFVNPTRILQRERNFLLKIYYDL